MSLCSRACCYAALQLAQVAAVNPSTVGMPGIVQTLQVLEAPEHLTDYKVSSHTHNCTGWQAARQN